MNLEKSARSFFGQRQDSKFHTMRTSFTLLSVFAICWNAMGFDRPTFVSIEIPKIEFENRPLSEVCKTLELEARKRTEPDVQLDPDFGVVPGPEITIRVSPKWAVAEPRFSGRFINQDLDTILEVVTSQVGYDWTFLDGEAVLFSSPSLKAKFRQVLASPDRKILMATRIPKIAFDRVPLSQAILGLGAAANANGLDQLSESGSGAEFVVDYTKWIEEDPPVSGEFIDESVFFILEVLTKQGRHFDWTVSKGNVVVFAPEHRGDHDVDAMAVDAFADLGFQGTQGAVLPGLTAVSTLNEPFGGEPARPAIRPATVPNEGYAHLEDNSFLSPLNTPLSTFAIDVDTASYSNLRRFVNQGQRPPIDAVRIEEMINYFPYDYAPPKRIADGKLAYLPVEHPFAANIEVTSAPWKPEHRLVRIGLKGHEVDEDVRPATNLVFLVDVSGSMKSKGKIELVKHSLSLLLNGMLDKDRIAIVTYAGETRVALKSTPVSNKAKLREAIEGLNAAGSTNAGAGIELAYGEATRNLIEGGNNRVVLCTDGDFNVGITQKSELKELIEEKAALGVQLSILGFGMGNYKDDMLETLSNYGDGNYGYIDNEREAKKVFVDQLLGTLLMIAKDVKIQVEFNPRLVAAYRLIGYENRLLQVDDFEDDQIDAGDVGSGHTVTALYEIVPVGLEDEVEETRSVSLKYQRVELPAPEENISKELMTLKLRYKWPSEAESNALEVAVRDKGGDFEAATPDLQFAASVAGFGMLLRKSPHVGEFAWEDVMAIAEANVGPDTKGLRREFVELAGKFETVKN